MNIIQPIIQLFGGFVSGIVNLFFSFISMIETIAGYIMSIAPLVQVAFLMIPEPIMDLFIFIVMGTLVFKLVDSNWGA